MGSSASKPNSSSSPSSILHSVPKLDIHCSSPMPKAFSFPMPLVHHPPARKGDSHHLVSLTSTTYGSLLLVDPVSDLDGLECSDQIKSSPHISIDGKKNPESGDSLSPDSVINTWELMDGLDDEFEFDTEPGKPDFDKKFEFSSKPVMNHDVGSYGSGRKFNDSYEFLTTDDDLYEEDWVPVANTKQPLWKHLSEESFLSDLDPNVVSSYKRALSSKQSGNANTKSATRNTKSFSANSLESPFSFGQPKSLCSSPLDSPFSIGKPKSLSSSPLDSSFSIGKTKSLSSSPLYSPFSIGKPKSLSSSPLESSIFSSKPKSLSSAPNSSVCISKLKSQFSSPLNSQFSITKTRLPGAEDKIVIYFTSLRGIRKTFEDCCSVRTIFKGFQVAVDERDISMDSTYRKELQNAVNGGGDDFDDKDKNKNNKPISLPQVFIGGNHIGGVDEIKQLNDSGELAEMLKGFPICDPLSACESCGDARFVPCTSCGGSKKVFEEEDDDFKRCPDCNENGLIHCPECSS